VRTRNRSPHKRVILIACLALFAAAILWLGLALNRVRTAANAVRADLRAVETVVSSDAQGVDLFGGVELLHALDADLVALRGAARPFLWMAPYLGWVPWHGADIQAAPDLLDAALTLSGAGVDVVEPMLPLLVRAADDEAADQQALLAEVLASLRSARPQLVDALSAVREAQAVREGIDRARLSARAQGWVARLDRYLPLLERAIVGMLVLPDALGSAAPRTYLVLVQNADELRATGGFISGAAWVTVSDGKLGAVSFEDSYAIDDLAQAYPDPPPPLREYMQSELWVFRDSNWSPDFPTSARAAIDLYGISRPGDVDGAIALDQRAIRALVDALGPLYVEGAPEPVTGNNVISIARSAWSEGKGDADDWWRHRKDFMAHILNAAARRLEAGLTQPDLLALGRALTQSLDGKHLLVYVEDSQAASWLSQVGWDGAMASGEGDYLYVVDTNMGFNKANALVQERLTYVVDLSVLDQPRAALSVHHQHTLERPDHACEHKPRYGETYEEMMERCYWDYLRVYVPGGALLSDATPHEVPGDALLSGRPSPAEVRVGPPERGRQVFATLLLLRPSEALETRFEYALPPEVLRRAGREAEYRLLAPKQPGTQALPLEVRLLLPEGAGLAYSDPPPAVSGGSEVLYTLSLLTDQTLRATIRLPNR
jgi:hypothetical protein